jgi:hypothetical protein
MGGAPVIETIRPGVQFTPDAAASFRRAEAAWGKPIRCNSTYRNYGLQLTMWQAWTAWTEGRGPKPDHSRALHPDSSVHCQGRALDTPDWTVQGFIAHMAEHGWIRTAASDPTEQHHFEYQWWRDQHRNEPALAGGGATPIPKEWDEMASKEDFDALIKASEKRVLDAVGALLKGDSNLGEYSIVHTVGGGIDLYNERTRKQVRIQSPYHVSLIQRLLRANDDDTMYQTEIDTVKWYQAQVDE